MEVEMTSGAHCEPDPIIFINADHQARIEALVERAMERNPTMANRLFDEISRARIVAPEDFPPFAVDIGSRVSYIDETARLQREVVLVFPEDSDVARQRVSVMTPLGVALLGLQKGQAFCWDANAIPRWKLTVTNVESPQRAKERKR